MTHGHDGHPHRHMLHHLHWMEAAGRGPRPRHAVFDDEAAGPRGGFRSGRRFDGADLRLLILHLLEAEPRHGYDIIKAVEAMSEGAYSPSPGVVYPALTYIEEAGYAAGAAEANRKLYTITDQGRAHLEENRDALHAILARLTHFGHRRRDARERFERKVVRIRRRLGEDVDERVAAEIDIDIPEVLPEVNEARRALKAAIRAAIADGEDAQRRLAGILDKAAADIGAGRPDDIDLG